MGMFRGHTFIDGELQSSGATKNFSVSRTRTMDVTGLNLCNERTNTMVTVTPHGFSFPGTRPSSDISRDFVDDRTVKSEMSGTVDTQSRKLRVPILGPTRQQTETYLFKMAKKKLEKLERLKQAVIPIDGPAKHLAVGGRLITGDIAVFEDKAANALLLDADSQHKSGYPTIATSPMVARRNRVTVVPTSNSNTNSADSQADMRFFSELVKPMQYRWKFQKDKLKTLAPSKHGFHQRSQSPTFQRLIEANEKLQDFAGQENDDVGELYTTDFIETQSELNGYLSGIKVQKANRPAKSEPAISNRTSYTSSLPATSESVDRKEQDIKPEIKNIDPPKKEKISVKEFDEPPKTIPSAKVAPPPKAPHPQTTPPQSSSKISQKHEIKVDFKRHDSHSELHLFLPHIHENNSRVATPEDQNKKYISNFELPPIDDSSDVKVNEEDKYKYRKKTSSRLETKRKKKITRIKSSKGDSQIRDILNDVPTLISLETDKNYHTESMCVFENCALHQHKKSTRIRQA
ncbi:hypothetical protein ACF0H5_007328 [Mactra antiquata]